MKTIAFCFVALFASTFAAPLLEEDDPFGNFSRGASVQDIEDKIIGGSETTIKEHPYIFSLRRDHQHACGGSILTTTRGLTTTSCFRDTPSVKAYSILAGSTTVSGDENQQLRLLSRYLQHPNMDRPKLYENNIAIVYWGEPLTFNDFVRAIALPSQGTIPDYTKSGTVSGWGRLHKPDRTLPDILRAVSVPLISNDVCNTKQMYDGIVAHSMLCAGLAEGGKDACNGDSGGPLIVDNKVFGLVSWGWGCAEKNAPGVYTRVPSYTNWIKQNL